MNSKSEQNYDLVPVKIVRYKNDTFATVLYANAQFYEFIGYSKQEFHDVCENKLINIIHEEDKQILSALSMDTYNSFYIRIICANNTVKWVLVKNKRIEDSEDNFSAVLIDFLDEKYLGQNINMGNCEIMCLLDIIPGGLVSCCLDDGLTVLDANFGFYNFFGIEENILKIEYKNQLMNLLKGPVKHAFKNLINNCDVAKNSCGELDIVDYHGENKRVWVNCSVKENLGGAKNLYCFFLDMPKQSNSKKHLVEKKIYELVFSQTQDVVYEWDCRTGEIHYSENFEKKFGYSSFSAHFPHGVLATSTIYPEDEELFLGFFMNLKHGGTPSPVEFRIFKSDGAYIWCRVSGNAIEDNEGNVQKVIGMICDIDKQKQKVLKAQELAKRDPLTGLYNHGATEEHISRYLFNHNAFGAMMVIDVDNFKEINDSRGHIYGDAVLSEFASRLKNLFGKHDIIGRFGGDEFVVFLSEISEVYDIERCAKEVLSIFNTDFFNKDKNQQITVSIGIAKFPSDGCTYKEIFQKADIALYFAKNHGKNTYAIYNESMVDSRLKRANIGKIENARMLSNNLGEHIFRIFCENSNVENAISILLDFVGKSINASRLYIFEQQENQNGFLNTFEWCNKGIKSMKRMTLKGSLCKEETSFGDCISGDVFCCRDVSKLDPSDFKGWLETRNVKSTIIYKVYDEGKIVSIIGLEQCENIRDFVQQENDVLALISQMISLFLIKKRKKEALKLHISMAKNLLNHFRAFFYVIDPSTYKILHFDKNGVSNIPQSSVGQVCYRVFRNLQQPCDDCPIYKMDQDKEYSISHIYNQDLNMWTENHASLIKWKNGQDAYLISSIDITKYKQSSLVDMQHAKDVYYQAMYAYLIEKDVDKTLSYIDDNIHYVGTGTDEVSFKKSEFESLLIGKLKGDFAKYSFTFNHTQTSISSGNTVILYTIVKIKKESQNYGIAQFYIRNSATLLKEKGVYKIASIHGSIVSEEQGTTPQTTTQAFENPTETTWQKGKIGNYRFLEGSISGGMMNAYLQENLPLTFINDKMLGILGYQDSQDFVRSTKGFVINCVHKEDRERVQRHIWSSLKIRDTYEVIYRMLKKDGSHIWVCEKGKKIIHVDGKDEILCVCLDITSAKQTEDELLDNNERFRVVMNQSNICVWDYNIKTKQISHIQSLHNRYNIKNEVIDNIPETILKSNRIHSGSLKKLVDSFDRVSKGEKAVVVEICFWDDVQNRWCWEKVTTRTFFSETGEPIKAIGIGQDITEQKEAEIKFEKELQIINSLSEGVIATFKLNVTKNMVDYVQSIEKQEEINKLNTYDELLKFLQQFVINADEREKLNFIFSRANLLNLWNEGKKSIQWEFRRNDNKGNINWVCASVNICKGKNREDVYVSGTIRDIDESKKLELSLKQKVEKDPVTEVYNRETSILMISDAMKSIYSKDVKNVLLLITIENYKEILLKSGEKTTNKMFSEISTILKSKFGKIQILGRIYSESFLLLVGGHTLAWVEEMANSVVQIIKTPYFFTDINVPVIVSIGIAQQGDNLENFEKLYLKTSLATHIASSKGKSNCVVYNNNLDDSVTKDSTLANIQGLNKKKLKEQDALVLKNAVSMVTTEDMAEGIDKMLKDISDYYQSPHVFAVQQDVFCPEEFKIYEIVTQGEKINLQENSQKSPIKAAFKNWIQRLTQDGVIIANDKKRVKKLYGECFHYANDYSVDRAMIVPLNGKGEIFGFICMENQVKEKEDVSLLCSISLFVSDLLVKKQLCLRVENLEKHDFLTGLLNRESYLDYRISIKEDALSSLGFAVVDINGLKKINTRYGLTYGDNILKSLAEKLNNHFEGSSIYRFGEDEFIIISQNVTKESFQRKCRRFENQVHQNCTIGVSIGYVWADSNINLDNMMIHADERMMISKMEYYKDTKSLNRHHNPSVLKSIFSTIKKKEFIMYLQPKADVNTREIVSAEALVRQYKKDKGIIFPDKFIPQMEEDGTIKYLDLFMFEEVCKTIYKWIENGIKPITISLNFSRSTLLAMDLIDSMSLIHQKYNVPKELIEIEITESFGEMEKETVVQIGCKIVDMGFRLSLDDFGSKYSNIAILSAIKLNALKIDKSIVNDLFSNKSTRIVVKNFLCICKELGIESVAEGVETEEQLGILRGFGCDMAQGYLFNKPIPLENFEQKYLSYELV